jgi:hypothetical protein
LPALHHCHPLCRCWRGANNFMTFFFVSPLVS